jgi:hypothetical protein
MICTPGRYCFDEALTEPTGPCGAGHYCLQGAINSNPVSVIICIILLVPGLKTAVHRSITYETKINNPIQFLIILGFHGCF